MSEDYIAQLRAEVQKELEDQRIARESQMQQNELRLFSGERLVHLLLTIALVFGILSVVLA